MSAALGPPADLARMKLIATTLLVACFCLFLVSKTLLSVHPIFGFVAAFAEAATIGGLADWYAVVSLFRHPLNLPIPHTAIIPQNQKRIGDKLGQFIETHFLARGPVEAKLREIDIASFMAGWLKNARSSAALSRFLIRLLPDAMKAAEASGLRGFVEGEVGAQLQRIDIGPLAASGLRAFVAQGRHRLLLDKLLHLLEQTLEKPEFAAGIRDKVKSEMPTLLRLYRADGYLSRRILAAAGAFLTELRHDPDHQLRQEFDDLLANFADRLETDPGYGRTMASLKDAFLAREEVAEFLNAIWENAKTYAASAAEGDNSMLQRRIARLSMAIGEALAADPRMRTEINAAILTLLTRFVEQEKTGVSTFVSDQVKSWDMGQLIGLIEANIGKDLQYIRLNGTIIGGAIGIVLHTIETLISM